MRYREEAEETDTSMAMLARRLEGIAAAISVEKRAPVAPVTLVAAALAACGHAPPAPVTVLLDGRPADVAAAQALLTPDAVEDLMLRVAALAPPEDVELGEAEVAAAYQAFLSGDGSRCRERIAAVDLPRLLAHRRRTAVARALLLDARCADGLGATAAAEARLAEFASYELELAEAAGVLSPSLRPRFDRALAEAGGAARARLSVDGAPGGRVLIDGKLAGCAAPCAPAVSAGAHVVSIEADGVALAWAHVAVGGGGASLTLPRQVASAAEASSQWHARAGSGLAPDDAAGLRLLPLMAKDDWVAYLRIAPAAPASPGSPARGVPVTLLGAMAVRRPGGDAVVSSRGQRLSLEAAPALVRQLAIDAKVIVAPRPRWFWPVLAGSVVVTAAVTAFLLYQPETRTELSF